VALREMQAVLARLYTDKDFRRRFFDDPNTVCSGFVLTPGELGDLSRVKRTQVERFARTLVRKREEQVREIIPGVSAALSTCFSQNFGSYCEECPSAAEPIADAASFIQFLSRLSIDAPGYLPDLIGAERYRLELLMDVELEAAPWDGTLDATSRPRLSRSVRVAEFQYDIERIYDTLICGDPPTDRKDPCTILIGKVRGTNIVKFRRLNAATALMVGLCDGDHPVEVIMREVAGSLGLGPGDLETFGLEAARFLGDLARANLMVFVWDR